MDEEPPPTGDDGHHQVVTGDDDHVVAAGDDDHHVVATGDDHPAATGEGGHPVTTTAHRHRHRHRHRPEAPSRPASPPAASSPPLPFFVYGTLRPGEPNHAAYLHGRTAAEEPARWPGALLYDGPGYPYAVEAAGHGPVHGELVTARPASYARLLVSLDLLEEYVPGDPRNLYERIARDVIRPDGTTTRAWIYVAAPRLAAGLLTSGTVIDGGDWTTFRTRR